VTAMPARRPAPSTLSLTGRLLQRVVRLCCARPALTVSLGAALAVLGAGYAAHSLTLETSKFHLLPLHQRYASLYKTHAQDFGQLEDLVVVVQSPAVETSTVYAARLAGALRDGGLGTARISYRIDASRLGERVLLYLPLDTLRDMLDTVAGQEDLLADFAATPTLDRLVHGINQYVGAMFLPAVLGPGAAEKANPAPARLLRDLLTEMSEQIDGRPHRSPWASLIAAPALAPDGGYFLSHDRRLLYVVIDLADAPRTFAAEHAAVGAIRSAIESLRPQFPSVEAGVTGAPALFSDELSAAARDGRIASILALVLTLGLLLLAFRRLVTSCAMLAALALSLGWSLGVITLLVGHLTIFSMMFVSARFVEELRTIDPDVTGQPVVAYESLRLIEKAYREGMAYAVALVAGISALMIRRVRATALAMVPLLLGTLWTVAIMQLAGLKFNLVNVWALPLIIGSAAEYGVNIVLRALESSTQGGPRLARSTVMGVVFNGLTTMAGFGSLLVAHHRGVWSLGVLLVIGSAMTLAASLVVLPTLVHLGGERLRPSAANQGPAAATVTSAAS
jgi:predicted RND superfamily exporter protein